MNTFNSKVRFEFNLPSEEVSETISIGCSLQAIKSQIVSVAR